MSQDKPSEPASDLKSRRAMLAMAGAGLATLAAGSAAAQDKDLSKPGQGLNLPPKGTADTVPPIKPPAPVPETALPPTQHTLKRSPGSQKRLDQVLAEMRKVFNIPEDLTKVAEAARAGLRIEESFSYKTHPRDADFVPLHVEPLLDQAADLLDRSVKDRAVWDELAAKMFTLLLELLEFAELDKIHQEEEAAGVYEVPAKRSHAEQRAERTHNGWQRVIAEHLGKAIDEKWTAEKLNAVVNGAALSGWIQGLIPYTFENQKFTGYVEHTYGPDKRTVADHGLRAAIPQAIHSIHAQGDGIVQEQAIHAASEKVSAARLPGLTTQADWDAANNAFLRRRTLVVRTLQDQKMEAAFLPDGVLNYAKRLPALKTRFQLDFREALARMKAAQKGLAAAYGYDEPLPADPSQIDYYDNCLLWTRKAIQWLIRFARVEQSVSIPFSVREMVGEAAWIRGGAAGRWSFVLPKAVLDDMAHLRLRGMSAYVVHGQCRVHRIWRIAVQVPKEGEYRHLDGSGRKVDQSMLPEAVLARVSERSFPRDPDVVGLSSLHNASPLGIWEVRMLGTTPSFHGNVVGELCDIQLDLQLAFRRFAR